MKKHHPAFNEGFDGYVFMEQIGFDNPYKDNPWGKECAAWNAGFLCAKLFINRERFKQ